MPGSDIPRVSDGKVFRQVLKGGMLQPSGVTANVVWYAVKRCAEQAGINNLAPPIEPSVPEGIRGFVRWRKLLVLSTYRGSE